MHSPRSTAMPWILLAIVIIGSVLVNAGYASSGVKRNYTPDQEYETLVCPEIKEHVTGEVRLFSKGNRTIAEVSFINGDETIKQPNLYYQYTLLGIDAFSTDDDPNHPAPNAIVMHMQVLNEELVTLTINQRVNGVVQEDWRMCYVK